MIKLPKWLNKYNILIDDKGVWDKDKNILLSVNRTLKDKIINENNKELMKYFRDEEDKINETIDKADTVVDEIVDSEEATTDIEQSTEKTEVEQIEELAEKEIEELKTEIIVEDEKDKCNEYFNELLLKANLTEEQVAEKTGLSEMLVKRFKTNSSKLTDERAELLANVFEVEVKDFIKKYNEAK